MGVKKVEMGPDKIVREGNAWDGQVHDLELVKLSNELKCQIHRK